MVFGLLRRMLEKYYDILSYLFFGVLTTLVNWVVYSVMIHLAGWPATPSKDFAWIFAVLFAFFTNKPFVYRSYDWHFKVAVPEFFKFVGCRMGSGLLEIGFIFLLVDWLHFNADIMNILISVFVVVFNYIGGKLLFKQKKEKKKESD